MAILDAVRVGDAVSRGALTVFPLFGAGEGSVDYVLSDEAIAGGTVVVEEVSEGGSVPELRVTNKGARRVLFLEGEELRGAKQNRVLNTSVLVGAGVTLKVPVSCVEQGRWRYASRSFESPETHSPSKLRRVLKESVTHSLKTGRGHVSDQMEVWSRVQEKMREVGATSDSMAMAAAFESRRVELEKVREAMGYVAGATGVAVALGGRLVSVDVFSQAETCRKVWDRLLSGVILDALTEKEAGSADRGQVEALLGRAREAEWTAAPAVGDGQEYRAEPGEGAHASALVLEAALVHGSVVVG